jgi:adenylyltransferase/sulfurtransferase
LAGTSRSWTFASRTNGRSPTCPSPSKFRSAIPNRLAELPQDAEIVVYCRTGGRSANAVQFLRQKGYEKSFNLTGGINHWAVQIDPTMQRY